MAKRASKVQSNFNAGILSPYMEGRPDVAQFYNGMLIGRNIFLLPEGGFENAPGTKYKTTTKDNGYALQIAFQPTEDTSFELEVGVGYIRFRKHGEIVYTPLSGVVTNGTLDTTLTGWTNASIGSGAISWVSGTMKLAANSVTPSHYAAARQAITTIVAAEYTLTFDIVTGLGATGNNVSVLVGTSAGASDLALQSFSAIGTHSFTFTAGTTSTHIQFRVGASPTIPTKYIDNISVAAVSTGPYEISTPYTLSDLAELQGGQGIRESVDVMFLCCSAVRPKELVYGGDTNWTLRNSAFDPMPSFEDDTDISYGTITLTPAAVTGADIVFTASSATFLNGDVGRVIKFGLARALIITFTSTTIVRADILVDFPSTSAIPAGSWVLEGSPGGSTLDVPHRKPIGRTMFAVTNVATFRAEDVGKFIKTYGGLLEIIKFVTSSNITVRIRSELTDSTQENPVAAPAGSWTMEVASWSDILGWPTLNEFFQGRYALASNENQRTTMWMSQTNNLYNFAIGALATDAVEYTHRAGVYDKTKWLLENGGALYFANGHAEHSLKGSGVEQPIGGDVVPFNRAESHNGAARMRPLHVGNSVLFPNWTKHKVLASAYNFDRDAQIAKNSLFLSRDLAIDVDVDQTPGLSNHAPAYVQEPLPLIFWRRNDGVLLVQSFNDDPEGGNNGWTTYELDGDIESYCVTRRNGQNVLSLIVNRTIDGATVRYIEEVTRDAHLRTESAWTELQTECAIILEKTDSADQDTFTGLDHLEGETVQVLLYKTGQATYKVPRYMGTFTVASGAITLSEVINYPCKLEVGKPLVPLVKTMRPAIPEQPTDGHLRQWTKCMLRLQKSSLPVVNGTDMQLNRSMDSFDQGPYLRSGDFFADCSDSPDAPIKYWEESLDGYIHITRAKPYPLRLLLLAGEVAFSDSMAVMTNNEGSVHVP
jgi:hypothetical protein